MAANSYAEVLSTIGRSAKHVVSLTVVLVLLTSESPLPFFYVTAAVLTSLLGKVLKQIVRQPRPERSPKKGYGLPSSHTGAISFFAAVLHWKSSLFLSDHRHRVLLNAVVLMYAVGACYWRVVSHLHSVAQILAGATLGLSGATLACFIEETGIVAQLHDDMMSSLSIALDGRASHLPGDTASVALLLIKIGFSALGAGVVFHREILAIAKALLNRRIKQN